MRNKLLITAAIGTMMSTAVFAQSPTAPSPTAPSPTAPAAVPEQITPAPTPGTAMPVPPANTAQPRDTGQPAAQNAAPAAPAPRNFSTRASNILPSDTQSNAAPALPTPPSGDNGSPQALLRDARAALDRGQTGLAQEAIERAEARVLSRAVPTDAVGTPVQGPVVDKLKDARHALGRNDIAASRALLDEALTALNKSAMN